MDSMIGRRRRQMAARGRAVAVALALAMMSLVTVTQGGTAEAQTGSPLMSETFEGTSAVDPNIIPLGAACLTAATTAPPAGESTLGPCPSRTGSPPATTPGYLQLTDASLDDVGAMLYNRALPSNGGIQITFEQYQYGGTGADGIGFFLVDGSAELTAAGAYGGSLGYAQRDDPPTDGVTDGYLGVGLDAYGNYENDTEGRGNGCSTTTPDQNVHPNSVGLRGPGNGMIGYCWLTGNEDLPGDLRSSTATGTDTTPALRTVQITVTPGTTPTITVAIDFNNGSGYQTVLSYALPTALPPTFKFGLAGSTGASTDVHLIRNLSVTSLTPLPEINLVKQVDDTTPQPSAYAVGSTVPYQFVVTNTTPDAMTDVTVTDPNIANISCPSTTLGIAGTPTATMVCTGDYTIPEPDATDTSFTNTATATGVDSSGNTVTSSSSATVALAPNPAISVVKTGTAEPPAPSGGPVNAGDQISYTFLVTDTGNTDLTGVAVDDSVISDVNCPTTTLTPGTSTTCTATYTVTQADVDSGSVSDSATASGNGPDGTDVTSVPSTSTIPTTDNPQPPTLTKSATLVAGASGVAEAGDVVDYTFTVSNPVAAGNLTLQDLTIEDNLPGLSAISCPTTTLAPGASTTCTATYTLTQADIDSGTITNTATASGSTPSGVQESSSPSSATVTLPAQPSMTFTKSAAIDTAGQSAVEAGDTVTYSYGVTNTGNVTLTQIDISDHLAGLSAISCPTTTLAPGASTTCTAIYTLTQADVDAGEVVNTATVTAQGPNGSAPAPETATATVTVPQVDSLALVKTASISANANGLDAAGATISYSYLVTNTGTVTLHSVGVSDALPGLSAISCPTTTLAPGTSTTCTATYTVTQADVDSGHVVNSAVAQGLSPSGSSVQSAPSGVTVPLAQVASLSLVKTATIAANANGVDAAGSIISYSYLVTNTGTVTEHAVAIADHLPGLSAIGCPTTTLAPGASTTCAATYTVTQADVDSGSVVNSAVGQGLGPNAASVQSLPSSVTVPLTQVASLSLAKTAVLTGTASTLAGTATSSLDQAGDTVIYSYDVTNTGTVTVSSVGITDGHPGLSAVGCPVTTLAPGASTTCSATYTVTQADVDSGQVVNSATAQGLTPGGAAVRSPSSSATVPLTQVAELSMTKSGVVINPSSSGAIEAGDTVQYSYVVSNGGTVTLTNLAVSDPLPGLSAVDCPTTTLAPGASTTCTATYTLTQADVDAGLVANTATASASTPSGGTTSSQAASATVAVPAQPGLSLVKSVSSVSAGGGLAPGDTIDYSFDVTNTGNVTLSGLSVDDPLSGLSPVSCPTTTLAPGASATCTASYVLTQADVNSGGLTNAATADATAPNGTTTTSASSSVSTPIAAAPSLALQKTGVLDFTGAEPAAGDTIDYSFDVTNTGNVTISGLSINDSLPGLSSISCPTNSLTANASTTCTATYTVTQADIDAGSVTNTATASGSPPGGGTTTSPASTTQTLVPQLQQLSLVKTAVLTQTAAVAGTSVTFDYTVSNTGNTTISGVAINDGLPGLSAVTCPATTLAPGASTTCTATYTVTQPDVDSGSLVNTATALGTGPEGSGVESPSSSASVPLDDTPGLSETKTGQLSAGPVVAGQSQVGYSLTVQNTGEVTLNLLGITDPLAGLSAITCPETALAPAQTVVCTADATVTQAEVDQGSLTNSAAATAETPGGSGITSLTSTATTMLAPAPGLSITKSVVAVQDSNGDHRLDAGDTVQYGYTVTNTGNVTITQVAVADNHVSAAGVSCDRTTLAPGQTASCSATYTLTQADVDNGGVTNVAVASGSTPDGATTSSPPATATAGVPRTDQLSLVKAVQPAATPTVAGTSVTYSFLVTDTGNTTVNGISIHDPLPGLSPVSCPTTTLAPGASTTCTATYTVTEADVAASPLLNTATALGSGPTGANVTSPASSALLPLTQLATGVPSGTTPTTTVPSSPPSSPVSGQQKAQLALTKTGRVVPAGAPIPGQSTIDYTFSLHNTGTVTLTKLSVVDKLEGLSPVSCPVVTLTPGARTTCTATEPVTQADVDAGYVDNTATATGVGPASKAITSPASSVRVPLPAAPGLMLVKSVKSVTDPGPNGDPETGSTITYQLAVTNTGNVPLTQLTVNDPLVGLSAVGCPATTLSVGETTNCTATETVTAAQDRQGKLENTATATAGENCQLPGGAAEVAGVGEVAGPAGPAQVAGVEGPAGAARTAPAAGAAPAAGPVAATNCPSLTSKPSSVTSTLYRPKTSGPIKKPGAVAPTTTTSTPPATAAPAPATTSTSTPVKTRGVTPTTRALSAPTTTNVPPTTAKSTKAAAAPGQKANATTTTTVVPSTTTPSTTVPSSTTPAAPATTANASPPTTPAASPATTPAASSATNTSASQGSLAFTGADIITTVVAGLALIALGGGFALVAGQRRRRLGREPQTGRK